MHMDAIPRNSQGRIAPSIRRCSKTLATSYHFAAISVNRPGAILWDHFGTAFLVLGIEKAELRKEAPLRREFTMLSIGEQLVFETYKGMGSTVKIQC